MVIKVRSAPEIAGQCVWFVILPQEWLCGTVYVYFFACVGVIPVGLAWAPPIVYRHQPYRSSSSFRDQVQVPECERPTYDMLTVYLQLRNFRSPWTAPVMYLHIRTPRSQLPLLARPHPSFGLLPCHWDQLPCSAIIQIPQLELCLTLSP
jgi:hypothetical protein